MIQVNGNFILRNVAGEYILLPSGETALKFNGMIPMNETCALIFTGIQNGKNKEEILAQLTKEYEVDTDTASADYDALTKRMCEAGILCNKE